MKRKCEWCEKTTNESLNDFHEIGWSAVSLDNKKAVCACKEHRKDLKDYMQEQMGYSR